MSAAHVASPASRQRGRRRAGPEGPTPGSPADDSPPPDPESVARQLVLRRLTAAPATRAQLTELLASRGFSDEVSEPILDRFVEVGLIDDSAFAHMWVQSRHASRGLARRALRQELARKGIDRETAEASLETLSAEDERNAAQALVRRKLPSTSSLDRQARIRRLVGMLARRGFSPSLSMSVVLEALGDECDADPTPFGEEYL